MAKYLTGNPAHERFLDLLQTKSVGFKSEFFKYEYGEIDNSYIAPANRIKFAVQDAVQRISKLGSDVTKTVPAQNEAARQIYDRLEAYVQNDIAEIRTKANADGEAARDRAFSAIAADPDKAALYAETRAIFREKAAKGDPAWPAEATRLVKTDPNIAAALNAAPAFNSGMTEERRLGLVMAAVEHFAPADAQAMVKAVEIGAEADKIDAGMRKLKAAAYDVSESNKARQTYVDPNAKFAEPPAEAAE